MQRECGGKSARGKCRVRMKGKAPGSVERTYAQESEFWNPARFHGEEKGKV